MLDQNKTSQELLDQNVISNLLVGYQEYDINSKYWGRYEPSDIKTINGESIFEDGGGDIVTPIIFGDIEHSAVLRGGNNQVISDFGVALGKDNVVGCKGWYYKAIRFDDKLGLIYLYPTSKQQLPDVVTSDSQVTLEKNIVINLVEGDIVSVVNDSKYDNKFKVNSIDVESNGRISLTPVSGEFPFTEINTDEDILKNIFDPEDYGFYCVDKPNNGLFDMGQGSFVAGYNNKATNGKAVAFGSNNHAYGKFSFAEGRDNNAGYAAHAEGRNTNAIGSYSHTEGQSTTALGAKSHAEGTQTETYANNSHVEGYKSIIKDGTSAHVEGYGSVVDFTESTNSIDIPVDANKNQSIGAHVEGVNNRGAGIAIHVEGKNNRVNGLGSHAEGGNTRAGVYDAPTENVTSTEGIYAHAEGNSTLARGSASHAEGAGTQALARAAHAEGRHSIAAGNYSHAEGFDTFAGDNGGKLSSTTKNETIGFFSHAEGHNTLAQGNSSHAEGKGTKALNIAEHASGKYNVSKSDTQFSIGIGTSDTKRKNAFEVKQNGDIYIKGLGGYEGNNSESSSNLAKVITDLDEVMNQKISKLIDNAPETYDTLKEIADYIAEDKDHAASVLTQLSNLDKKIDTKVKTAEPIQIAGGPLANDILDTDNWPDDWYENPEDKTTVRIIPANTSFDDILRTLFLKEEYGTAKWGSISWGPYIGKPSVTLSKSGSLEAGEKITINKTTAGSVSSNTRSATCTASYGYFLADANGKPTGSHNKNTSLTVSKGGGSDNKVSYTYTWNGSSVNAGDEMQVKDNTNTLMVYQTGPTVNVEALPTTKVFASTNTKRAIENVNDTLTDTKPDNRTLSNSRDYTVTGVRYAFTGAVASGFVVNSDNIRTLLTKNGTSKNELVKLKASEGNTQVIIAFPSSWGSLKEVTDVRAMNSPITNDFILTDNVPVYGANGYKSIYYKVYVNTSKVVMGEVDYDICIE